MKKNLVALLLVLVVVSFGLFAVDNVDFKVTTEISAINAMKLSSGILTLATFDASTGGISDVVVTDDNVGDPISAGYISTKSNRRTGYSVEMSAIAMVSAAGETALETDPIIKYDVTVGAATANATSGIAAGTAVTVIDTTDDGLTVLAVESKEITIEVNEIDFAAALEGSYVGTVIFEYKAD